MKRRPLPSKKILHECFEYTPKSPSFLRWKKRPKNHFKTLHGWKVFNSSFVGKNAGTLNQGKSDYYLVAIAKTYLFVHRIVFSMFNDLPEGYEVDHIDGNTKNNSVTNLRLATRFQNTANAVKVKRTSSGIKGVTRCSGGTRWQARIRFNHEKFYLGSFPTKEQAAKAYEVAAAKLFKEFNRK